VVDIPKEMITSRNINFIWDYMIDELTEDNESL
jgi:hypothetical protein